MQYNIFNHLSSLLHIRNHWDFIRVHGTRRRQVSAFTSDVHLYLQRKPRISFFGTTILHHTQVHLCILMLLSSLLLPSCVKDMQDELNNGDWNHERSILDLKLENQVGKVTVKRIDDQNGEVRVTLNVGAIKDLSKVKVENIILSYQATANVKRGETLDFNNPERKATITVTSPLGESRTYMVYMTEFRESLEGTWNIDDFVVYGGTGPEYGGGRVYSFMDKPWCWYDDYSPSKEYDNTLTFTLEHITDEGNTMGSCVNDPGPDGKYADFIFKASSNPETHMDIDKKDYYRKIPEGESQWIRNYATGTITFIDKDGKESTGTLENAGTYDLGYNLKVTIPNNAFVFNINGVDDWTYIYTDYDVFVKKARKFYVMVTKNE